MISAAVVIRNDNKWLNYRREIALHSGLVSAESGRLELGDNISRTLYICLQPL